MLENFLREYNMNRILLSVTGLWPYQNKRVRNLLWSFCFLVEISYYPFEILLLYDHSDDAQLVFEGCYQILILTSFIVRHLNDVLNRNKIRWIYEMIDKHWNIFTNDIEIRIMKEYSILSRRFIKYYSILYFFSLSVLIIMPLTPIFLDVIMPLNESRPRFFAVEIEFRVNKDDYFLPIFCYTSILIVLGAFIGLGVDAKHIICTAHACSLFAAISKQIENIISKENNNKKNSKCKYPVNMELDPLNEELMYKEYIICLKKHQLAIEFVNTLESSYKGISLFLLILLIGTISLIATRIIYVLDQAGEIIKFAFIFAACIMTLMILCYSGQRLMDESQSIFYRAYAAEWYKFSPRLKSLLIITLYRSNVPCGLKAGNMIPLCIATFAAVSKVHTNVKLLLTVCVCVCAHTLTITDIARYCISYSIQLVLFKYLKSIDSTFYHYILVYRRAQVLAMLANFLREHNVNRVFLSISGLWLFQSKNMKNSLRTICLLMEISYFPFEVLLVYDHWDDPQMIVDGSYQLIFTTAFIARALHNIWNQNKLQQLCIAIDKNWDIFTNDVEVGIMKDYAILSRRFTIVFSVLLYSIMLIFITIPLIPILLDTVLPLNESRPRIFAIEIEFRVNKDDYFLLLFCYTTIVITIGLNITIGVDTMHITCTAHACSLFAAVSKQIENIISKTNNNNKVSKCGYRVEFNPLNEEIIYREYIICLKKHQLAIEFVNILESSFQGLSLFLLLLILGNISLIGVRVSNIEIISIKFRRDILEYAAEWYKFSPRLKSLLLITLYRSNIPCGLKAGNVIPLSIATYAAVSKSTKTSKVAFL
ncbi:Odorant receptor 22b [Cyphomyrmex costatus]|uniref:Odorant receptor 22b n=1 Tax=Cyphomyrmex costatus TaxID=456900 RepID=A0A195CRV4_9HYME|nr:Odorant receptor 22b [Cyphomyrmex costatus]